MRLIMAGLLLTVLILSGCQSQEEAERAKYKATLDSAKIAVEVVVEEAGSILSTVSAAVRDEVKPAVEAVADLVESLPCISDCD